MRDSFHKMNLDDKTKIFKFLKTCTEQLNCTKPPNSSTNIAQVVEKINNSTSIVSDSNIDSTIKIPQKRAPKRSIKEICDKPVKRKCVRQKAQPKSSDSKKAQPKAVDSKKESIVLDYSEAKLKNVITNYFNSETMEESKAFTNFLIILKNNLFHLEFIGDSEKMIKHVKDFHTLSKNENLSFKFKMAVTLEAKQEFGHYLAGLFSERYNFVVIFDYFDIFNIDNFHHDEFHWQSLQDVSNLINTHLNNQNKNHDNISKQLKPLIEQLNYLNNSNSTKCDSFKIDSPELNSNIFESIDCAHPNIKCIISIDTILENCFIRMNTNSRSIIEILNSKINEFNNLYSFSKHLFIYKCDLCFLTKIISKTKTL